MKTELMQTIVDKLSAAIEAGVAPWQKPWESRDPVGPVNLSTGKAYRGINRLYLMLLGASPYWVGYKQAKSLGGNVRKGAKATSILFPIIKTKEVDGVERKVIVGFGSTNVFNVLTDCEGIELPKVERTAPTFDATLLNGLIANLGAKIVVGGDRAFYMPSQDVIGMPAADAFKSERGYWGTILHELVHWTGHESRLDRLGEKNKRGYAFEELVAEMGAYFLGESLGLPIEPENHASYVESWLKAIKDDPAALTSAATLAERAAEFITNANTKAAALAA